MASVIHRLGLEPRERRRAGLTWVVLALYAGAWTALDRTSPLGSWYYFRRAARALVHGGSHGGLHVYHHHPEDQFGPISILFSVPFAFLPKGIDKVAVGIALTVIGLVIVYLLAAFLPRGMTGRPEAGTLLWIGAVLLPVWTELSINNGHLDDALALLFGLLAVRAATAGRPVLLGVLLAAAVDSKPWALAYLPLILALPRGRREGAWATLVLGVMVAWLPFFVGDSETIRALTFSIDVAPDSPLHVLGVNAATTPAWCRPVQFLAAFAVGGYAVRARLWPLVLLAAAAARIGVDPQTYRYYTSGAVVAALLADRTLGRRWPWLTLSTIVALWIPSRLLRYVLPDLVRGGIRLGWAVAILLVIVWVSRRGPTHVFTPRIPGRHRVVAPAGSGRSA